MEKFILGYPKAATMADRNITRYANRQDAADGAAAWCEIIADNLAQAKKKLSDIKRRKFLPQ